MKPHVCRFDEEDGVWHPRLGPGEWVARQDSLDIMFRRCVQPSPNERKFMTDTSKKINHEISDWVGDIVALESHVEEAMDGQLKLESGNAGLTTAIKRFHDTVRDSKQRAVNFQKDYGSEP